MFEEIENIFSSNKIHIVSQCAQKAYEKYVFDIKNKTHEKSITNQIDKYKNIIIERKKIISDLEKRIQMFEKIKNNNILYKDEMTYCDEYMNCEKEKLEYQIRHIENYINEHNNLILLLEKSSNKETKILSLNDFYEKIWLKIDYYDRPCVRPTKDTTCLRTFDRCQLCYDE
jgi:hypothetical protein